MAWVLGLLGNVARAQGDREKEQAFLEEARALYQELGDEGWGGNLRMEQGHVLLELGDYAAARSCYEEGLAVRRAAENSWFIAWALLEVGHAAWLQGEAVVTRSHALEAVSLFQELGNQEGILAALESLTVAALAQERKEHAARLMGAVEALREGLGLPVPPWWRRPRERMGEALRAASLEQLFAAAWEEGRGAPPEGWSALQHAIRVALDEDEIPTAGGKDS